MDLVAVSRQMFALYGEGKYEEGLALLAGYECRDLDEDTMVTFWRACLNGVSGQGLEAHEILQAGVQRGLWWAPEVLADSDLDSARSVPGWDQLLEHGKKAAEEFKATHPPVARVLPGDSPRSAGNLIVLHGAGADPQEFAARFRPATPPTWTLVVPEGPIPFSRAQRSWHFGTPNEDGLSQLDSVELGEPTFLSGFSQGCAQAAWWAWNGHVEADGVILFAVSRLAEWEPTSHRPVPTYMVVGDRDFGLPTAQAHVDLLEAHDVPVHLDVRAGLGHKLPEDLPDTVATALDWLRRDPSL
jgi:predicted esterase